MLLHRLRKRAEDNSHVCEFFFECGCYRDTIEHRIYRHTRQALLFLERNAEFEIGVADRLSGFVAASPEGWFRILPGLLEEQGGLDGFFMARLVHKG